MPHKCHFDYMVIGRILFLSTDLKQLSQFLGGFEWVALALAR